jgi:hypothetical protein
MLKGFATVVMVYETEVDVTLLSTLELHSIVHLKHVIILHAHATEKNSKHLTYSSLRY